MYCVVITLIDCYIHSEKYLQKADIQERYVYLVANTSPMFLYVNNEIQLDKLAHYVIKGGLLMIGLKVGCLIACNMLPTIVLYQAKNAIIHIVY